MKKSVIISYILFLISFLCTPKDLLSQNVGIGITTPAGKLHVKGTADVSQLIIDANATQSNINPMIRLRNSSGTDLMWIHSDDISNTFVGLNAGNANNAVGGGLNNTFIGRDAGYSNTTGYYNSAIGMNALSFNTLGHSNTANGFNALVFNTTGYYNTASGSWALRSNTTGFSNTANGREALFSNTSGSYNTADGMDALVFNTTGNNNTACGSEALFSNTLGNSNTASGYDALYSNTTGVHNTANGDGALYHNTNGSNNTAIGTDALSNNTTGYLNTANGESALYFNTTGFQNTACGINALQSNTTGFGNTAMGFQALWNSGTVSGNTAIGYKAGDTYINASDNTFLGNQTVANANGYHTSTAIGAYTSVTASNQVRIGNAAISIGGPQDWTNTSDGRIKENIKENVHGLDFIKLLRPVTYTKNYQKENEITNRKDLPALPINNNYEKIRYSGFIAQEVEQASKDIGYDFSGVDPPKDDTDLYGLRYAEFVVPLVKAVQEQQAMIEKLEKRVEALETANEKLMTQSSGKKN